jgi:membrane protease YdiL (CAAX protease family)
LSVADGRRFVAGAFVTFIGAVVFQQIGIRLLAAALGVTDQIAAASKANGGAWWLTVGGVLGLWPGFALGVVVVVKRTMAQPVRRVLEISFSPVDLFGIPIGIAAQFTLNGLTTLLFHPRGQGSTERWLNHLHGVSLVCIAVSLCLLVPVLEESLFRGLLGRGLYSLFPPTAMSLPLLATLSVVVDGLIFSAAHGDATAFMALFVFGGMLQLAYLWTGRLGLSIVTHASFNIAAVVPVLLWGWS